jgi:hypothetical protein
VTIATASGERQQTPTDGLSQATYAAALAVRIGNWLRDESRGARFTRLTCQVAVAEGGCADLKAPLFMIEWEELGRSHLA